MVDQVELSFAVSLARRGELVAERYLLGDVLGIGGMGVVYAAVQRSLDRTVAIKLPRPELVADAAVRARFRSEALAASRLDHRNIVRVHDYGDHRGAPYLVMEHVAGPRLAQLLLELGPLPVATALGLARQIVSGLEEAHAQGIVHADVKCDNILVDTLRDGALVPRLIDFGIARFVADRDADERTITGTPDYLAPEVICGEAPTFAADVHAIGVLLYELVTGTTPFGGGSSTQVMNRRLEDEAVPIALRCPDRDIPAAFDAAVMRSLAKDRAKRFVDARELGRALDEIEGVVTREAASRKRPSTAVPIFSTEAITATMSAEPLPSVPPLAEGSGAHEPASRQHRRALATAIAQSDGDAIVVACLDLARSLVSDHRLAAAISELEAGIAALARVADAPVWRLQLTLAALYDGVGDRGRARQTAREARRCAEEQGSAMGIERAIRLCSRLARRRSATRGSRPW